MADREPTASNGIRTGQTAEWTDAALEARGNAPSAQREQGAPRYPDSPKLGTRKMLWVMVLTLPLTIGVLAVSIGFFGAILQMFARGTTWI